MYVSFEVLTSYGFSMHVNTGKFPATCFPPALRFIVLTLAWRKHFKGLLQMWTIKKYWFSKSILQKTNAFIDVEGEAI